MEMVHGNAGSTPRREEEPVRAGAGRARLSEPTSSRSSLPNTHLHPATPTHNAEGRSRCRKSAATTSGRAVFLTQSHPKQTEGNDVRRHVARSALRAAVRPDTPIPPMQLSIENAIVAGGCTTATASTPTRSAGRRRSSRCRWCATRARVFDQLFGVGATAGERAPISRPIAASSTDPNQAPQLKRDLGSSDRARPNDY